MHFDYLNVQGQQKMVWPTTFVLARAYVDQLQRSKGLATARLASLASEIDAAERAKGSARKTALALLGAKLDGEAGTSSDAAKVRMLSSTIKELAAMP